MVKGKILSAVLAAIILCANVTICNGGAIITKKEFDRICDGRFDSFSDVCLLFPRSYQDIRMRVALVKTDVLERIRAVKAVDQSKRTFENTVRAIDTARWRLDMIRRSMDILPDLPPDESDWFSKSLPVQVTTANQELLEFEVEVFSDCELYLALKTYVTEHAESEKLNKEEKYFLEEEMKRFTLLGLGLDKTEKQKFKELKKRIAELGRQFLNNIAHDKSFILVPKDGGLSGVGEDFRKSLDTIEKEGEELFVIPCNRFSANTVPYYCSNPTTREQFHVAFNERTYSENKGLLNELVAARHELAILLGYKSYAELDIDSAMAKTVANVMSFIEDTSRGISEQIIKEIDLLFRTRKLPDDVELVDGRIRVCDYFYVRNNSCKKSEEKEPKDSFRNSDEINIKEYLEVDETIKRVLDVFQDFFGITFKCSKTDNLWCKDLSVVEVFRDGSDKAEGYILLDLYPRPGKFKNGGYEQFVGPMKKANSLVDDEHIPSVSVVVTNFHKPADGSPVLLSLNDLSIFFHEFGHALHGTFSKTEMGYYSNTTPGVKKDFIEVPSMMFGKYPYNIEVLRLLLSHYKTGKGVSDEVIMSNFLTDSDFSHAFWTQGQFRDALFSLRCFDEHPEKDLDELAKEIYGGICEGRIIQDPDNHSYTSFLHLEPYGAKYYTYMWSSVIAKDFLEYIKKNGGLLDPKVGKRLASVVLGKGGSSEPGGLVETFLGRKVSSAAFLKDLFKTKK